MKNSNAALLTLLLILIGGFIVYGIYFTDKGITNKYGSVDGDTIRVTNFDECARAGNPVMESYPRQCAHEGTLYFEEIKDEPLINETVICSEELRDADFCIEIYQPVCGKVTVACITEPCNPAYETFSNFCFACSNQRVESYTRGECS